MKLASDRFGSSQSGGATDVSDKRDTGSPSETESSAIIDNTKLGETTSFKIDANLVTGKHNETRKHNSLDQSKGENKEKLIKGIKYSSNTGLDPLSSEYSSKYGSLDSKGAWGGNPQLKYFTYLELDLSDYYYVTGIVTAGNEDLREWVTEFYVEYWDVYHEMWKKYDKLLTGNSDDRNYVVNRLNIRTNKIRVYPVNWERYPSMRVGVIGIPSKFSECKYYRTKLRSSNLIGDKERAEYYRGMYDKKCKKIDPSVYQKKIDELVKTKSKLESELKTMTKKITATQTPDHEQERATQTEYCPKEQLIELVEKMRGDSVSP